MKDNKNKERTLSKAELKRKEEFEKLSERLAEEGYVPNHITMSVATANIFAFVAALPIIIPLLVVFFLVWQEGAIGLFDFIIAYLLFFVFIVIHELIHGITWSFFAKNGWKSIRFGFICKYLTPYCHCSEPMKKRAVIIGGLMPTVVLGIMPAIIAIISGSLWLMLTAVLMIFGGGGDILMSYKLLCYKSDSDDILFMDHPYEIGTAVFEK